jgi:hypothetical protein
VKKILFLSSTAACISAEVISLAARSPRGYNMKKGKNFSPPNLLCVVFALANAHVRHQNEIFANLTHF